MKMRIFSIVLCAFALGNLVCSQNNTGVMTGLEILLKEQQALIAGKRVGIISNQTGVTASGEHIVDVLSRMPGANVTAVFSPEHGFRGNRADAIPVASYTDEQNRHPGLESVRPNAQNRRRRCSTASTS